MINNLIRSWCIKAFLFVIIAGVSCKERFDAKLSPRQSNYLVVEGYINAAGVTKITLRRTLPLTDTARIKPELLSRITIEGEDNSTFFVNETGNGLYQSAPLNLTTGQKYRLHIKTASNGEYLSEFTSVSITPPIDSISWKQEADGVQIFANTHDRNDNTRYYKWDYEETWEIHSAYSNFLRYENGIISPRSVDETNKLYYCWRYHNSESILLGSSAQLINNVISLAPLTFLPSESEKTAFRYSILVRQQSLDRKAYDFYKLMKSNTESLGSVFDPLPSDITGNITCVSNPLEKVIGHVSVSTTTEKRIFISRTEIITTWATTCFSQYVVNHPDSIAQAYAGRILLPYESDGFAPAPIKGYFSSSESCIDCTMRGSNVRPAFW